MHDIETFLLVRGMTDKLNCPFCLYKYLPYQNLMGVIILQKHIEMINML